MLNKIDNSDDDEGDDKEILRISDGDDTWKLERVSPSWCWLETAVCLLRSCAALRWGNTSTFGYSGRYSSTFLHLSIFFYIFYIFVMVIFIKIHQPGWDKLRLRSYDVASRARTLWLWAKERLRELEREPGWKQGGVKWVNISCFFPTSLKIFSTYCIFWMYCICGISMYNIRIFWKQGGRGVDEYFWFLSNLPQNPISCPAQFEGRENSHISYMADNFFRT